MNVWWIFWCETAKLFETNFRLLTSFTKPTSNIQTPTPPLLPLKYKITFFGYSSLLMARDARLHTKYICFPFESYLSWYYYTFPHISFSVRTNDNLLWCSLQFCALKPFVVFYLYLSLSFSFFFIGMETVMVSVVYVHIFLFHFPFYSISN